MLTTNFSGHEKGGSHSSRMSPSGYGPGLG